MAGTQIVPIGVGEATSVDVVVTAEAGVVIGLNGVVDAGAVVALEVKAPNDEYIASSSLRLTSDMPVVQTSASMTFRARRLADSTRCGVFTA